MSHSFADHHPNLRRAIADLGFKNPTPIQAKAIPPAMEGRDVLACAMTGSGKTAAFLLPILERLIQRKRGTTRALVLSPTRELAAQTVEHMNDLAKHTKLRAAAVYGGVGMKPQEEAFRRGVDVLVACPGRLLDHFSRPYGRLDGLEVLVLDEADRMLDMGFLPDIRRILKHLPERDQNLFFSATMPKPIADLSREMLYKPVRLDVERPSAPATGIKQMVYPVRQDLKMALLLDLLDGEDLGNVLVFTRTKHRADRLCKVLTREGVPSGRIHGNRSQAQRTRALADFKSGATRVLVATDIAARGIDVEALSHVVNFDVPNLPEDYIHRVGRTARAQATGVALTFVSAEEKSNLRAIECALGKRLPQEVLEGFGADAPPAEQLEIPIAERLAAIRAQKARARANKERKANNERRQGAKAAGRPAKTSSRPKRASSNTARPGKAAAAGGASESGRGGGNGRGGGEGKKAGGGGRRRRSRGRGRSRTS